MDGRRKKGGRSEEWANEWVHGLMDGSIDGSLHR